MNDDDGQLEDTLKEELAAAIRAERNAAAAESEDVAPWRRNDPLPEIYFEPARAIATIKAPALNVRMTDQAHINELRSSLRTYGAVAPLIIRDDGMILDGVIRLIAAQQERLDRFPCIVVPKHFTEAEFKALRIVFGSTASGRWHIPNLRLDLTRIGLKLARKITLLKPQQFDIIMGSGPQRREKPQTIDTARPAVLRLGDVVEMGDHRLICADALEAETYRALLGDRKVAATLTDPPFDVKISTRVGRGRTKHREFVQGSGELGDRFPAFLLSFLSHVVAVSGDGALVYVFMDHGGLRHLLNAAEAALLGLIDIGAWDKMRGGQPGKLYRQQIEHVGVFKVGEGEIANQIQRGRYGRDRTNLWRRPGATTPGSEARKAAKSHPTPKDVKLVEDLILDSTQPGALCLDPFAGSGTIFVAAERAGRRAAGIELDPLYADLCVRRWQAETGKPATLLATGERFDDVAERGRAHAPLLIGWQGPSDNSSPDGSVSGVAQGEGAL